MIRVVAFVGNCRIGCDNGILRIALIWSPNLFASAHGDTMVISCTTLGTHDIIIAISLRQMGCLDTATIGSAFPDAFGIADNFFLRRIIFHHADGTGLFVSLTSLPFQRNNILSAIVIVENRGVKTGRVQIHRFAPRTTDILCCNEKIVHIKIPCIHGIHHAIDHIKQIFFFTVGQTGCPDAFCRGQLFQIYLCIICQHMGIQLPVFHVLGVINGNTGKPFKGRDCQIVIIALAANARVGVETG